MSAREVPAEDELLAGLPFINLELVLAGRDFNKLTERTFATDRNA